MSAKSLRIAIAGCGTADPAAAVLFPRWLTPWFQSDHEWLSPVRRMFFVVVRRVPWARRFMTLTMVGLVGVRGVENEMRCQCGKFLRIGMFFLSDPTVFLIHPPPRRGNG